MSTLPEGWQCAALAEVCEVVSGGTPKTGVGAYWDGGIPWVTPKDLALDKSQVIHGGARSITSEGLANSSAKLFPAGSVIVSSRAPIGYVAIAGEQMSTNQGCKIAVPPPEIDSRYLYWYMLQARDDMEARASGTTFKEISGKEFGRTVLRWPDLDEQRRIVDILEDHLSRLDAAEQYLKSTAPRLDTMRLAILARAFPGHADERQETILSDVARVVDCEHRTAPAASSSDTYAYSIRTMDVAQGILRTATARGVNEATYISFTRRAEPSSGDLILSREAPVGQVGYVDGSERVCLGQRTVLIQCDRARIRPKYLTYALLSPRPQAWMNRKSTGTTVLHLNVADVRVIPIGPLPSLMVQDRVVAGLNVELDRVGSLLAGVMIPQRRTTALRRTLLSAAFSGRLTGRSPALYNAEEVAGV